MVSIHVTTKIKGTNASAAHMLDLSQENLTVAELIAQTAGQPGLAGLAAPERAQQAFTEGAFTLIVDGEQACKLDEMLHLRSASRVTFLHLSPPAEG